MTLRLKIAAAAEIDLEDALEWYSRRSKRAAANLLAAVETAITLIVKEPDFFGEIEKGIRRAAVKRFPYAALYRFDEQQIEIVAILHNRRDPQVWQSRV